MKYAHFGGGRREEAVRQKPLCCSSLSKLITCEQCVQGAGGGWRLSHRGTLCAVTRGCQRCEEPVHSIGGGLMVSQTSSLASGAVNTHMHAHTQSIT